MKLLNSLLLPGALALSFAGAAQAQVAFSSLQLNGSAAITGAGTLQLTSGFTQASSAYYPTPVTLGPGSSFTTTFQVSATRIQKHAVQGDGFAFVMQNDPTGAAALGYDGACLAVCDISNYAAIAFRSYYNDTVGLWLNGVNTVQRLTTGNKNDVIDVTVTYNQVNTTLAFTAYNETNGITKTGSFTVDLTTLGPSFYVGFSGATGAAESDETVNSWTFNFTP